MRIITTRKIAKVALFLAATLLSACGDGYTDTEHVQRAKEFWHQGDIRASVIELKNALQKNLDNAEARWLLGEIYLASGEGSSAEKELVRALELGVSADAAVPAILKAKLKQNQYSDVITYDTDGVRSNQALAEVMVAMGLAHMHLGDEDKARDALDRAIKLDEDSLYALVALAQLSMRQRRFDEMERYLEQALALDEDHAPAWSLRAEYAKENQQLDQAIEAYTRAIKNRHDNAEDMLRRALVYIEAKRYDEAQKDIDRLRKRYPNQAGVYYAQGMLHFYQERISDARIALEQAVNLNPRDAWSTYYLGVIHFVENNHEQARVNLSRFVKDMPGYVPGRKLLAFILLKDGQFGEAESLVRPVLAAYPEDVYAMNILASALLGKGESAEAMQLLERVVALEPDSATAQANLGINLLRQNELAGGIGYLERAIDIDPGFGQAQAMLAMHYLQKSEFEKAIGVVENFLTEQPDNPFASVLAGRVYLAAGREADASRNFLRARELSPGDPSANSFLAAMATNQGRLDEARRFYRDILAQHENHLLTLVNLAILDARTGDRDTARASLERAIKAHPTAVQPRSLLAREYLKDGKVDRARSLIADILNDNQNNPVVLGLMGEIHLAGNEFVDARSLLTRLVQLQPQNASAHYFLAMSQDGLGLKAEVRTALNRALELAPDYVLAKIALARLHLGEGDLPSARRILEALKAGAQRGHPAVLTLEGEILAQGGEPDRALTLFSRVYDQEPTRGNLRLLSRHLLRMGEQAKARDMLAAWVETHPEDIDVRLELANHYLGVGQVADAVAQYRQVLNYAESNLIALNNLAWNLRASAPQESLEFAEKAHALAPESVSIMDTLALSLLENGEVSRAQRILERALAQKPGDPSLVYHQALVLEQLGQGEQARAALQALLDRNPHFPERADAERLLGRLSDR